MILEVFYNLVIFDFVYYIKFGGSGYSYLVGYFQVLRKRYVDINRIYLWSRNI